MVALITILTTSEVLLFVGTVWAVPLSLAVIIQFFRAGSA